MNDLAQRAAAMAERARSYAKDRVQNHLAERLHMEVGEVLVMHECVADMEAIEDEIADAFVMGWAVRDEQGGAGRLPGPRKKR